jgi:hypothetical protein
MGGTSNRKRRMAMSQETTTQPASTSKKPAFIAYSVRDRGEKNAAQFIEIGVAFTHKDGKGFDILCHALPLTGRVTLRSFENK